MLSRQLESRLRLVDSAALLFQQGNGASGRHLPVYVRFGPEVKEHFDKKFSRTIK
jgi:hypothetical protein